MQQYIAAYEGAGCDELILFPATGDPEQVDLLAEAAGLWFGSGRRRSSRPGSRRTTATLTESG